MIRLYDVISYYERLSIDLSSSEKESLSLSLLDKHQNRKDITLKRIPLPTRFDGSFFLVQLNFILFSSLPIIFHFKFHLYHIR